MPPAEAEVIVSWSADRRRFARGLREFPLFRRLRRRLGGLGAVGALSLALGLALPSGLIVGIGVYLLLGGAGFYGLIRLIHLRQTIQGTLRWTIGGAGVRVEGYLVTDVPWAEVERWYVGGDHLILGVRKHTGGRSDRVLAGLGAPLDAFTPDQWARARAILATHVGPEH